MSVSRAESRRLSQVSVTGPAQLFAYFDRISEAPDAIPRLRRFILDLAVRGKLVEQDAKDEPASQLIERIKAAKETLERDGKATKPETQPAYSFIPRGCVQRHIGILKPSKLIDIRFLSRALESDFIFGQASASATGIAQKTTPLGALRKTLVPVPPSPNSTASSPKWTS